MTLGERLRQLRLARRLPLEALAASMGGIVTKQALSKYELGKAQPSCAVLNKLASALGVKAAHLVAQPGIRVEFIAYRKGSGLLKREQAAVECLVREALEERVRLRELMRGHEGIDLPLRSLRAGTIPAAGRAAETLRSRWRLGLDPIADVTAVLEERLIHVIEIDAGEKFDGLSGVAYDEDERPVAAAVVSRRGIPGERQRLNLAHELGHLVLRTPGRVNEDKAAFRFAGAFLAPAEIVRRDVGTRRRSLDRKELLLLKKRYGMSVQALLYRLRDLDIISESYYKACCIHINRLGWKKREPDERPPEQPRWFRQNTLRAAAEGLLPRAEAERTLGEEPGSTGFHSIIKRRAFLKLPMAERRRKLRAQAERSAKHYDEDKSWNNAGGGDIVEY